MVKSSKNSRERVFSKGNLVFLTKFGIKDQPELVLEVESYDSVLDSVSSSKLLLIQKEVKGDAITLVPLGNSFILSPINGVEGKDGAKAGVMYFNVNNFDIFGIVDNEDIINIFNTTFYPNNKK